MNNPQVVKVLGRLARIVDAGEKGYAVSAANMDNPGLKILFKSFAQQRADFKNEILAEIKHLGGNAKLRSSVLGTIHRGRIDIFAALTIGKAERERVVFKEVLLGEKTALRTYEKTIKAELPSEIHQMVSRQYEQVQHLVERVRLLLGRAEKRMIVRLFDMTEDVDVILTALIDSGIQSIETEKVNIDDSLKLYEGRGSAVLETSVSGAVGGALWGSLMGGLAGLGAQQTANLVSIGAGLDQSFWPFISLLIGVVGGALFGSILGLVIGVGISEEDNYSYRRSLRNGQIILLTVVEISQAAEAQHIIADIKTTPQVEKIAI